MLASRYLYVVFRIRIRVNSSADCNGFQLNTVSARVYSKIKAGRLTLYYYSEKYNTYSTISSLDHNLVLKAVRLGPQFKYSRDLGPY
jgi:hypothetical protein